MLPLPFVPLVIITFAPVSMRLVNSLIKLFQNDWLYYLSCLSTLYVELEERSIVPITTKKSHCTCFLSQTGDSSLYFVNLKVAASRIIDLFVIVSTISFCGKFTLGRNLSYY